MLGRTIRISAFGLLSVACAVGQAPQASVAKAPPAALEKDAWRADLKYFAAQFSAGGTTIDFQRGISSKGQKDFAKLYPAKSFQGALESLDTDLATLSDSEITLRLMRLVASANVAHTTVYMPLQFRFFRRLPLTLYWCPDGLGVLAASEPYVSAIGAKVLRLGNMTPEEALAAVAPYISHENDVWLREQAPGYLVTVAMLERLNLLGPDRRVNLTLQKPDGETFTLDVAPDDPRVKEARLEEVLHTPTPLFLSQPSSPYWYRYLEDSGTLYIQYNRCWNDPKHPFADFVRSAMADADSHKVRRVVIDLRLNGGGDSRVIGPLRSALASRRKALGPVYALIGPGTFSSGLMAAIDLRQDLHATLVGSATGEKPNSYGEVKTITLPNSKLVVAYSAKYFRLAKEGDPATLAPDILAERTFADVITGRDPALETVIPRHAY